MSDSVLSRTNILKLTNIQAGDLGDYTVTVTNSAGETASKVVQVLAAVAPTISVDLPSAQNISEGSEVTLSVTAAGLPEPTFQWQKNGVDISGATGSSYTVTWVRNDSDDYTCVVTNKAGTVSSTTNTVTVTYVPEIITQPTPSNQTVNAGAAVVYQVVVDAVPTATLQWRKDVGGGEVDIVGETDDTLILSNLQTSDSGQYWCVVTNTEGVVETVRNVLLVQVELPVITVQPVSDTAAIGETTIFSLTATGADSFQWKKAGVPLSELPPFSGTTTDTLTITNVQPAEQGAYTCEVTNASGTVVSDVASLTIGVAAPAIIIQPVDQSVTTGNLATFTITATGTPSPTFQWRKDTVDLSDALPNISGSLTDTLTIDPTSPSDAGVYDCVVTNLSGSVVSNDADLFVDGVPVITLQPVSQTVDDFDDAVFTVEATATPTPVFQWEEETAPSVFTPVGGAFSNQLVLSDVTIADDGRNFRAVITNAAGSVISNEAALTITEAPAIITNPLDATLGLSETLNLSITASGTAISFQWEFDSGGGFSDLVGETSSTLTIPSVTLLDAGKYRCKVSNTHATSPAISESATVVVTQQAPLIILEPQTTPIPLNGTLNLSVVATGSPAPTFQWQVNPGTGFVNLTTALGGGVVTGATTDTLQITLMQAADEVPYRCVVTNAVGSVNSSEVTPDVVLTAPIMQIDPDSETVTAPAGTSFSILATGEGSLSTQWQVDTGGGFVNLSDDAFHANTSDNSGTTTLFILQTALSMNGDKYRAQVTNEFGTTTSAEATLTVI